MRGFTVVKLMALLVVIVVCVSVAWRLCSRRFTLPCPTFLSWIIERDNPFFKINRAATIVGHAGLRPGMSVLDVGCGPGRITLPAARAVGPTGRVVALDLQEGMLQRTHDKANAEGLANIQLLHTAIGEDKLEAESFDRVLLVTVLGEIPDRAAALQAIYQTLKPGGILSVTETICDPHVQRRSTVLELAEAVGFQEKEVFGNWGAYTLNLGKPV